MDYNHITKFLDKFKKILSKSDVCYSIIAETISRHIMISIDKKDIKIKNTSIYVNSSPVFKNEILIHQHGILADLKELISDRKFTEIK